jgi:hypothetical protein
MLIAKLNWNLEASIIDAETAFLHGKLQEEIYMNIPEGMSYDSNHCLVIIGRYNGINKHSVKFYNV